MRRGVSLALALTCAVSLATDAATPEEEWRRALMTIDTVPTKQQINDAFGSNDPLPSLVAIATGTATDSDTIAIRLRAIHALAKYCATTPCTVGDPAHQAVAAVLPAAQPATSGSPVLVLRAAIETLGTMKVPTDVSTLVPLLDHPSRDIRAATARALRDLCNTQAITPLRTRYSSEMTDQVKLAISEALRILGQCSQSP